MWPVGLANQKHQIHTNLLITVYLTVSNSLDSRNTAVRIQTPFNTIVPTEHCETYTHGRGNMNLHPGLERCLLQALLLKHPRCSSGHHTSPNP